MDELIMSKSEYNHTDKYVRLLKDWCDSLIELQITQLRNEQLNGGFVCPSCKSLHGRADNAIFPLMYLYKYTGDKKYFTSAMLLFDWQKGLLCEDGGVYNDGSNNWKAITVFSAICYYKTIVNFGDLLDNRLSEFTSRLSLMAQWIYNNLDEHYHSNINYQAASSAAMALLGNFFSNSDYINRSKKMLEYCLEHFTENEILMGEGIPHNMITSNGCRAIDIGYNVEESVPMLVEAAFALGNRNAQEKLEKVLEKQLDFMLPDGAWDNSLGCRNYKWTYYGSRTSDGCINSYMMFGNKNPIFYTAAVRNADLMQHCTFDGLLYGGPDYKESGELPCVHHTFCHAVGLCDAILNGLNEKLGNESIPNDLFLEKCKYYPELNSYRIILDNFIVSVSGYDKEYRPVGSGRTHATGGAISLLYHKKLGAIIAAGTSDFSIAEPTNQQLSLKSRKIASVTPRLSVCLFGEEYMSCADPDANIKVLLENGNAQIMTSGLLKSLKNKCSQFNFDCNYTFEGDSFSAKCSTNAKDAFFILPIVHNKGVLKTENKIECRKIFNFTPGLICSEYKIYADKNGNIDFIWSAYSDLYSKV